MAFNPEPKVAAARDFAKKHNCDRVIIIFTNADDTIGYASYGETKGLCAQARKLADHLYDLALLWLVKHV